MSGPPTIGVVGCSKTKLDRPAPTRDLYRGPLFRAAAAHCERAYDRWFAVSALLGLVAPDQEVAPYETRIQDLTGPQQIAWADRVWGALGNTKGASCRGGGGIVVEFHAGSRYVAPLADRAPGWAEVRVPLAGLGIGERLAWYRRATQPGRCE